MTSILDSAIPVSETTESINMVLYGDPGSGKTVFAGSGPNKGRDTLLVGIEHGTKSAARAGSKAQVINVDDWQTLEAVVDAIIEQPDRYDWVVIDSLTKMQDLIWQKILTEATNKNSSRSKYTRELQEWGEAQERLKDIVRRLNASDANIIYTAMADLATDEDGNEYRLPALHGGKGAVSWWVCGEVDVVCYLSVVRKNGKTHRAFQFNKSDNVLAKDRFSLYPGRKGDLTLEQYTEDLLAASVSEEEEEESQQEEAVNE